MDNIESEVTRIVAEIIEKEPQEIRPEARFVEDLGVDSMMALEILAAIEKRFRVVLAEEKLPRITTLKETIEVTRELLEKKEKK